MSNETLGIVVRLSGDKAAADGLHAVADAEGKVAAEAGKLNQAHAISADGAKKSGLAHEYMANQLAYLRNMAVGALAVGALFNTIANGTKAVYEATAVFERYTRTLAFATGSQAGASAEMAFARSTANKLGLDLGGLTRDYSKVAAAMQGTSLAGQGQKDIFLGISQASSVLGLSADQVSSSLTAITQIVSKGVVASEELRGQLAEHLPGAMQIAARAMGKTTAEFQHQLETGQLLAGEFLPKFASELQKTFGPGSTAGVENLTSATNRFKTAVTELELKAGESGFAKLLAEGLNKITESINAVPEARIARLVNMFKELREMGAYALYTPNLFKVFAGSGSGTAADQNQLDGLQSDARARLRALPAYASTEAQNKGLEESKALYRELISLIEQRAVTTESAAKRMLEAEGKVAEALKKRSELDNRALARAAEQPGYYKNTPEVQAIAEQAQALYEKHLPQAIAAVQQYDAALGILKTALDNGVISSARFASAQSEIERTTLLALNATALQVQNAKTALSQQGFQNEIELQKQSLDTQRAALKSSLDARYIDQAAYAQRVYELDNAEITLALQGEQLKLAALASQREAWQRLEGQYLTANEQLARGYEWDQKTLAIKGQIAVTEAKRLDAAIARQKELNDLERAEFEVAHRIDTSAQAYLDTLTAQYDAEALSLSLLGKAALQQQIMNAQAQIQIGLKNELKRLDQEAFALQQQGKLTDNAVERINNAKVAAQDAAATQSTWTAAVLATGTAYSQMSSFVDGFINAAFSGVKSLKNFLKTQLFDYLKQSLAKPFIMQIAASVTGGLGATAASAAGSSSIVGSVVSSVLGAGSFLGGILGTGGIAAAGTALTSTLAATGSITGALGAAATSLAASGGILGAAASVLAAIPVVGWVVLAAGALALALGGRNDGFKIDNNLSNVGNPASHFTRNPIADYDVSGRGTDGAETRAALAPLHAALATIDDLLANKLLGADVLARIRANMNAVNNASSWENLDAKGIEKGSKDFLMQRYGVIFDQVDVRIAASVRGFTGTSEALLQFIGGVVGVMQTLKDNAAYFGAVLGEAISVGQLVDLQNGGESLAQTLNRVVTVFAATNGVAALMGRDVTTAFGAVGLASLAARQNLIDLAGGIQALDSMSKFFYENFYTEQERGVRDLAAANASVAATFAELNLATPATRAEFRALVEAQDLTTESGRQMWTALMRIAPAFNTVAGSADALVDTLVERAAQWDRVIPVGDRGLAQGAAVVRAELPARTEAYLTAFFTAAERSAMSLANNAQLVNETFARYDRAVPQTMAEFRQLAEGIDRTTAAGEGFYQALMALVPAFAALHAEVQRTAQWDGVIPNDPTRSIGQGAAIVQATQVGPTQAYLDAFFSSAERSAMSLANSGKLVNDTFARYDIAVPTTMAGFRSLVEGIDRSTEAGAAFYQVLMSLVPAFLELNAVAAATKPTEATDSYLANYFTSSEQAAYKLAQAQRTVNTAFAEMGVAAPRTRAEFVALVNAQDQSTEAGRRMVAMLMGVEPAFTSVTAAVASTVAAISQAAAGMQVGDLLNIGDDWATQTLGALFAIIDSTAESQTVKLQRKIAAATDLAARWDARYVAGLAERGGEASAVDLANLYARDEVRRQNAALIGDLALLTTLTAQFGDRAGALFELEQWRTEQVRLASNNGAQLLLVEQSYATRRNTILTGGVAAGLASVSTVLQDWLKSLMLNDQLSTLTPAQRLAESRAQYNTALSSGSDSELTRAADAYLREARASYASGDAYSQIFNAIRAAVAARADGSAAPVAGTPVAVPVAGSVGSGSGAATSASTVAASAATTAVAAANATVDAVNATKALLAEIMAQTKNAVVSEGQATRGADAANTDRLVAALVPRAIERVL